MAANDVNNQSHGSEDGQHAPSSSADVQVESAARGGNGTGSLSAPAAPPSDYPPPPALTSNLEVLWDEGRAAALNYRDLGRQLGQRGDLFRAPAYAGGLILGSENVNVPPRPISDGRQLAAIILDRVRVQCVKDGKIKGYTVPSKHLGPLLLSEAFLQQFRPIDEVVTTPRFLTDFSLTHPGYNDGGRGQRFLHVGGPALVEGSLDATNAFLDVMPFDRAADRTNAVAGALTVLFNNHWPGAKPILCVTSTKSHAGKDTIISFACNVIASLAVSYQATDWALERAFVGAINHSPEARVIVIENARLDRRARYIASAFVERLVTDPEPFLFSTRTGNPARRKNHFVVAISTNYGSVSEDLMNRALPIHLRPIGNVADRESPIGNPRLEYLPTHCQRIAAELRGMVERWKEAGQPLDATIRHPFSEWARTVGGILRVNGFQHFLANYSARRTVDDPIRRALGWLGAAYPEQWFTSSDWSIKLSELGLTRTVLAEADRENDKSRARGLGVILSAHEDETFEVETEAEHLVFRLEKARRRFSEGQEPSTRYRFRVLDRQRVAAESIEGETP